MRFAMPAHNSHLLLVFTEPVPVRLFEMVPRVPHILGSSGNFGNWTFRPDGVIAIELCFKTYYHVN